MIDSIASPLLWAGFMAFILAMLALDLGVFRRKASAVGFREAVTWSVVWILLALAFNGWIYAAHGSQRGMEFLTGYIIEKALSVDNVFVFLVVFNTFAVQPHLQHRVLFWGVVGALVMRAILILAGTAALEAFHGVIYIFGAILLMTGVKLLVTGGREEHPEKNPLFRVFQKLVPTSTEYDGVRFFTRMNGKRVATPLFAVLVLIEITDLVFAVDSIPAVFAVTSDPFIVFTSNIFAMLGLRALYFAISGFVARLRYIKVGLALVLVFVALKMLVSDFYKVPVHVSLAIVLALLFGATLLSLLVRAGVPTRAPGQRQAVGRGEDGDRLRERRGGLRRQRGMARNGTRNHHPSIRSKTWKPERT